MRSPSFYVHAHHRMVQVVINIDARDSEHSSSGENGCHEGAQTAQRRRHEGEQHQQREPPPDAPWMVA